MCPGLLCGENRQEGEIEWREQEGMLCAASCFGGKEQGGGVRELMLLHACFC